jgi:hypothetical protein
MLSINSDDYKAVRKEWEFRRRQWVVRPVLARLSEFGHESNADQGMPQLGFKDVSCQELGIR